MNADIVVEDWQFRVTEERSELENRLYKLNTFMKSKEYEKICREEQYRLQAQKNAMRDYAQALTERIAHFHTKGD